MVTQSAYMYVVLPTVELTEYGLGLVARCEKMPEVNWVGTAYSSKELTGAVCCFSSAKQFDISNRSVVGGKAYSCAGA